MTDEEWAAEVRGVLARVALSADPRVIDDAVKGLAAAGAQIVPTEPTIPMLKASGTYADYCAVQNYGAPPDAEGLYDAMLAAAPPITGGKE